MCGITAYCGQEHALPFLMQGLSQLEYRGYDSAGITILENNKLITVKCKGKLENLEKRLQEFTFNGHVGIGHTRWATHGIPSQLNSHPHTNQQETLALVHNGIIENYRELKEELQHKGYQFQSETDSETIVLLLDSYYQGDLLEATKKVLQRIQGSYALCILSTDEPEKIIVAKKDSPLIIGKTSQGYMAASDVPALLSYSKDVYFLADHEIAVLSASHVDFYQQNGQIIHKDLQRIPYDLQTAQKGGYDTFMLKEIYEQPHVISETLRGHLENEHIVFDELKDIDFTKFSTIYFVACGSAYHAALCGASLLEKLIKKPIITMVASEFRYHDPLIDEQTLAVFVSQSGETADTLAALRLAKNHMATTLAIANVLGSTISREADHVLYTCAGVEIAVASTKAYTTQWILLVLLSCYIAQQLQFPFNHQLFQQIQKIPQYIEQILKDHQLFKQFAQKLVNQHDAYFIGRGLDYNSVLEGALKLKEISYIHADAYLAGELKHGPIALIEKHSVVIAVATQPHIIDKTLSNVQETIARGADVILLTTSQQPFPHIEHVYRLPSVSPILQGVLVAIPLQFIAYYTAILKGCDVDKPRNLAKSVTVE